MDSFEFNKFAGAILFALLATLGVGILAEEIFAPHHPEKPGYEVAVVEAGEPGEAEAAGEEVIKLPVLLSAADVEKGASQAKKCQACHTFDDGGANKVGPNLWDIVDRLMGSHEGFKYSAAMLEHEAAGDHWTYENLDHFIASPKQFIEGTAMAFAGIKKPEDRADLLAYLQTLSDDPVSFPVASAEAPAAESTAAAAEEPAAAAEDDKAGKGKGKDKSGSTN
jgi:cytochrome c